MFQHLKEVRYQEIVSEKLVHELVSWIREMVSLADRKGVVLGMSGGVDSSVAAVLCKRALPQAVLGVIMPCYSSKLDQKHAELVASRFQIPVEVVVLNDVFDALVKILPSNGCEATVRRLAEGNIKPRLRMLTLYYFANCLNYLVVGSGNRSELTVGYFTKYGDGGVDIMPLGNLVKGQVRELARYLGIPQEIIDKPPSAGLWEGQTDEGELGVTYNELDRYLIEGVAGEALKVKIDSMISRCAHKRQLPPIPQI